MTTNKETDRYEELLKTVAANTRAIHLLSLRLQAHTEEGTLLNALATDIVDRTTDQPLNTYSPIQKGKQMPVPSAPDSMIAKPPNPFAPPPDPADLIPLLKLYKEEVISALAATLEVCLRAFDRLKIHPNPTTKATYTNYLAKVHASTNPDGTIIPGAPEVPQELEDEVYELQCLERVDIATSIYANFIGSLATYPNQPSH